MPELDPAAQRHVDQWLQILQRDHPDLQAHFSGRLDRALALLEIEGVDAWMTAILDRYDKRGLGAANEAIANLDGFAEEYRARQCGVSLEELEPFLEKYLTGLGGRPLRVVNGEHVFTDTESIYLPAFLNVFDRRSDNETLYKLTAVYHWAQNRYGGWRLDALERLLQLPGLPRAPACFRDPGKPAPGGAPGPGFSGAAPGSCGAWITWTKTAGRVTWPGLRITACCCRPAQVPWTAWTG